MSAGADPGSGHPARPGADQAPANPLRAVRAGLDGIEPALEQLRTGLPPPGGSFDHAGGLGALDRFAGLLGFPAPGLAYDTSAALLRRRRNLFGGGHVADVGNPLTLDLPARGHHHAAAH